MDIRNVFDRYRIPYVEHHHHVREGWVGIDCPYCSPGWGKYRLGFELDTGRVNCWQCGLQRGPRILSQVLRISFDESLKIWKQLPTNRLRKREIEYDPEKELREPLCIKDMDGAHRNYLRTRNLNPNSIEKLWKVKGIGIAPKLQWRLYIPIFDREGRQVSWTTRSICNGVERRYWSASEDEEIYPHKHLIYGEHLLRYTIILVEGPIDAWAIGPGAGATFGTACTQEQLLRISQYPNRVICYDTSAQNKAEELCRQLSPFGGTTTNVQLETGDDPASADSKEILELRKSFL